MDFGSHTEKKKKKSSLKKSDWPVDDGWGFGDLGSGNTDKLFGDRPVDDGWGFGDRGSGNNDELFGNPPSAADQGNGKNDWGQGPSEDFGQKNRRKISDDWGQGPSADWNLGAPSEDFGQKGWDTQPNSQLFGNGSASEMNCLSKSALDNFARKRMEEANILKDPVDAFRSVIAADREILEHFRREVDDFGDIVRHQQDEGRTLQQKVHERQQEGDHLIRKEEQLMQTLATAKLELQNIREEVKRELEIARKGAETRLQVAGGDIRGVNFDHFFLHTDTQHISDEVHFLQNMRDGDQATCDVFENSNKLLRVHNMELDAQLEALKVERKHIADEVMRESKAVKREERDLAELTNKVNQLRRYHMVAHREEMDAMSRHKVRQEMKAVSIGKNAMATSGHSWAHRVSIPSKPYSSPVRTHTTSKPYSSPLQTH